MRRSDACSSGASGRSRSVSISAATGREVARDRSSPGGELQHPAAAVRGIDLPADQALLGQGVDDRHRVARVDTDQLGQAMLTDAAGLAQGHQRSGPG